MINSVAEDPGDVMEIVVEAHKDLEVYVAPIKFKINDSSIEAFTDDSSVFGYCTQHWKYAKVPNGYGGREPITLKNEGFKVFSSETIKYAWDNCDYEKDPKRCSYKNNHYLLETIIIVDSNELVVSMFLYDEELQVISKGSYGARKKIMWIKQQAVDSTYRSTPQQGVVSQQSQCSQSSCGSANIVGRPQEVITVNKPKEELPLRHEIPHFLLDKYIYQASILLWMSATIK
tara:strand:- start:452 stop:1144 length:693 start_codon:yes stop_codon:yes gene_type:complete